jgi:hypothetical protein
VKVRLAVLLALAMSVAAVVVGPSSAGASNSDYCEYGQSSGSGGDYCECPSGNSVPEYCQHQPPGPGEDRHKVKINGHKLELTPDKRLRVKLRCVGSSGQVCRGNLYLRTSRLIGTKAFRVDAGQGAFVDVRPDDAFIRELESKGRVNLTALAQQDGTASSAGNASKKMLAVAPRRR